MKCPIHVAGRPAHRGGSLTRHAPSINRRRAPGTRNVCARMARRPPAGLPSREAPPSWTPKDRNSPGQCSTELKGVRSRANNKRLNLATIDGVPEFGNGIVKCLPVRYVAFGCRSFATIARSGTPANIDCAIISAASRIVTYPIGRSRLTRPSAQCCGGRPRPRSRSEQHDSPIVEARPCALQENRGAGTRPRRQRSSQLGG